MMRMIWVVLFLALTGSHCGYGLPVRPTPQDYPHDGNTASEGWGMEGVLYAAVPVLALVVTAVVLVFGCTWCYRHKDCKPNEGTDNQLFTASAQHLQAAQRVHPPDSGFSEPANNNISEDNNNGPISLREMQNIANNNATAYIVSENEERNRISRESVVEFEPLPSGIIVVDPLEQCADWFGGEDFLRNNLQYLREIGRGWFGRVVEGEIEEAGASTTVAVKILNQNATLADKARFLDESKMYRDVTHENILAFIGKCLQEDPWILMFELCSMDLQQYLVVNRPKMAALNENGVPLRLMCDISSALAYLHSRGYTYGRLWSGSVLVRDADGEPSAALGRYSDAEPPHECVAPELRRGDLYTTSSEIYSLGTLIWEVCSWGSVPTDRPSPPPDLPCPYKSHLYQVMQLCWAGEPSARPTAGQVHALIAHLQATHAAERAHPQDHAHFEERWQRLKPNTIPKIDEHVAIVHAPSNSRFNVDEFDHNTLGIDPTAGVSRSSSIMSDRDPLASNVKSESLTNLHGSLDDVRNIYLTHNETAALECHQGNIHLEDREKELDRSDASMDPWLKDIIAGSQDDVSYYKDVSDVIKNLDNILNSEKTSSSESSHQASPSRDNLSLDCKKEYPLQSSLVKSPGITNFQNIIDAGFGAKMEDGEPCVEDEVDRDTIGTLSHSFERHSDTTSQHTLENLTPDTPMKDFEVFIDIERQATEAEVSEIESQTKSPEIETETLADTTETETVESIDRDVKLPKEVADSKISEVKESIIASTPSVSDNERSPRKDCQTPCDNVTEIRTEDTKSIDDVREATADSMPLEIVEVTDSAENNEQIENSLQEVILPVSDETTINEGVDTLPSVTEDVSTTQENDTSLVKLEDIGPESMESENNYSKDETILVSDLADTVTDTVSSKDEQLNNRVIDVEVDLEPIPPEQTPVSVQNIIEDVQCQEPDLKQAKKADSAIVKLLEITPPEIVQNTDKYAAVHETENLVDKEIVEEIIEKLDNKNSEANKSPRSDRLVVDIMEQTDDSSKCMDLINNTNSQIIKDSTVDNSVKNVEVNNSSVETVPVDDTSSKNDSTQYLDLPSFDIIKKTSDFLQKEIMIAAKNNGKRASSTPVGSDKSGDNLDSFEAEKMEETMAASKTKMPLFESGTSSEQKYAGDVISPFESPSHKSHQTDTYEENSSVVLGPFENCATDVFKGAKSNIDPVELPREELLAFSSNFSEINLETPSPLRDQNFLNEVPDIAPDSVIFDDLASITEPKADCEASEDTESGSGTQKRVSPSTPPNSPGISLASTSQEKYLVDIDLSGDGQEPDSSIRSIDLNQIELQITSKLAMAENENNVNIEYSGPLTVEGLIEEGGSMRESDAVPEIYLAGNGGSVEDVRELLSLNEECVQALRNELELKLPLAQVASIEPAVEAQVEWGEELPPPPELLVNYLGALSPIQEETGVQLSAYENDTQWNPSTRTDSSESYPEPCNNSTESATSLPRGDTYTVPSRDMQTLPAPDDHRPSTAETTMSVDSLNCSPRKTHTETNPLSPIDDQTHKIDEGTYTVEDEREVNCERISQVSPFLVSPTTDTETGDNATRVSTLSRTTLPTDAKHSKASDTQCLSKATSIDSWCSNDTLYNVEENFDDLAMDTDIVPPCEEEVKSESTDTLTHDDDREASHCSTYLIHDSKSDPCDTFSPDSITNRHDTYTKVKPEAAVTPSGNTDLEDSKNTNTKDLAYGTLMSGMPSFSICSTEVVIGAEEHWRLQQPEQIRRSPYRVCEVSPPKANNEEECAEIPDPQLTERRFSKMDSVDITCLRDNTTASSNGSETENRIIETHDSPKLNNMVPTVTSTPLVELSGDFTHVEAYSMILPETNSQNAWNFANESNEETFQESDIDKLKDNSENEESEVLLEGLEKTLSLEKISLPISECNLNYTEFENSVACKPQGKIDLEHTSVYSDPENSKCKNNEQVSKQSTAYSNFESSAACKPQENTVSKQNTDSNFENSSESKQSPHDSPKESTSQFRTVDQKYTTELESKLNQDEITTEQTLTYSDFESSAVCKPQEKTGSVNTPTTTGSDFESSSTRINEGPHSTYSEAYSIHRLDDQKCAVEDKRKSQTQDKIISEQTPTYSDFENSAVCRPQEKTVSVTSPIDSDNSSRNKSTQQSHTEADLLYGVDDQNCTIDDPKLTAPNNIVSEQTQTYSDFENSAVCKPQERTVSLNSAADSDFESSAARSLHKSQIESNTESLVDIKECTIENERELDCEHISQVSPLLVTPSTQDTILSEQNSSELDISAERKLPDQIFSKQSLNYSDFENSVAYKSLNKVSSDKSSQSMESGISSEGFRSFENSVKGRPQDLTSLIDASSQLLNSERMFGELVIDPSTQIQNENSQSSVTEELTQPIVISPPSITNLIESHQLIDSRDPSNSYLINFDLEDETEQPHSIIVTEVPMTSTRISPNRTHDSHTEANFFDTFHSHERIFFDTFNSHEGNALEERQMSLTLPKMNGESHDQPENMSLIEQKSPEIEDLSIVNLNSTSVENEIEKTPTNDTSKDKPSQSRKDLTNGSGDIMCGTLDVSKEIRLNGGSEKFATVNFLNETFEELLESSVDDSDRDDKLIINESHVPDLPSDLEENIASPVEDKSHNSSKNSTQEPQVNQARPNGVMEAEGKLTAVTQDFLQNEKKFATLDPYFPLLSDIRFTGPASEMMSTSFQDSPTSPNSPECEQDSKPSTAADILKEWDSDSESHSSNSSSGEFIWKDGDGHETSVVPTTYFDHQRGSGASAPGGGEGSGGGDGSGASDGSGDSGSGSEGDEVEFVPSSWDCRAEPSKSSLRSLEQATPESKKRVVFKRQKYHCVYEYPREAADAAPHSPAFLPDLSTYCEWDPTSAEEAELCYGQLFSSPSALGVGYPLRAGGPVPFGADYDEDFFISSSARPFESLGIMSTTSQFFPGGMHGKCALLERSLSDEGGGFPAPPTPIAATPSLDFTTPDSGVEDITPGSTLELHFDTKKTTTEGTWRPLDSGSSSESVSPSSPGGELGGLRHTRDRLKLDLPPSPHAASPSPRHSRVFNFSLNKRRPGDTPLVMTEDTPIASGAIPLPEDDAPPIPEPTFSTFGKSAPRLEPDQKIILTDEPEAETSSPPEPVATVLDSGDEDSGIESSSKATLERKAPNVS